jgi:DNA-binding NarL/FixJ family response regulator
VEAMPNNGAYTLIVARPGSLRDGLQALMTAIPQIGIIDEANDIPSAWRTAFEHRPTLVVLDSDSADGEIWLAVRRAKALWPQAECIFLANDVQQHQAAEAAGADAALLKGFPAARLVATIVRLLHQPRVQ